MDIIKHIRLYFNKKKIEKDRKNKGAYSDLIIDPISYKLITETQYIKERNSGNVKYFAPTYNEVMEGVVENIQTMNNLIKLMDEIIYKQLNFKAMKKYLGVKIVSAESMDKDTAKSLGYKVGDTTDGSGYEVTYEDGYKSWSPFSVFEKAYREIDNLTFGLAIEAMKMGKKVARAGWNGKNMFLFHADILNFGCDNSVFETLQYAGIVPKESSVYGQTIVMKAADDKLVFGWLASQTDILAEDWQIVE